MTDKMPDMMGLTVQVNDTRGQVGLVYERVPGTNMYSYVNGAPEEVRCPPFLSVCPHLGKLNTKLPEGMKLLGMQYGTKN